MNFDNFKKIMQDKKKVVMVSVAVLLLLLAVVGTTYAYFTATVIGNKDDNNVVVTNGVMALEYIDGNQVALTNAVPGDNVTKTFKVKNTGNVTTTYTIYMSELVNDFADKTDLVYTLTGTNGGKNVSETQVPDSSSAIASDVSIDAGVTQEYTLVITFKETNDVQDDNQGKKFSTKIQINEVNDVVSGTNLVSKVKELSKTDTVNFAMDDSDSNIRYIGADPNNYIYFNCDDYNNQSDSTCEKWRIIGVFKNMTKADGAQADLVKIIRDDIIGGIAWDSNSVNDWSRASLQKYLNGRYYGSGLSTSSGETTGETTKETTGESTKETTGEITAEESSSVRLKNDATRGAIESVVWSLGGSSTHEDVTASMFYERERGTTVYSGHAPTWTGKIGLMYPSDYGYATSGGSTTDRAACLAKEMLIWNSDCENNDYLLKGYYQWTLAPSSSNSLDAFSVYSAGYVDYGDASTLGGVRPVAFLKSNISITNVGTGTSESPFQLKVG